MTEKQNRFADHFIATANASEAARKAGYSERTARVIGQENLTKPAVRAAIDERLNEMASERIATAEESMRFLTSVMRGEFKEEVVTQMGKKVEVAIPTAQRLRACESLLKIYGMFREKVDVKMDGAQLFVQTLEKISADLDNEQA